MRGLLRNFFVFAALSIPSTQAQVVQDDWLAPALPDLSTTITIGETYDIQWTKNLYSWFPQYAPSANITDVDLWITTSESADEQILIQAGVNVNATQSISWVVSISPDQLTDSTEWTFRFLPAGTSFTTEQNQQVSSPKVVVRNAASSPSTTSTSASASSASATSTTLATSTTASSSPSTTSSSSTGSAGPAATSSAPISRKSSSGISGGAIAGIVIGCVIVAVAATSLFFFFWFKKRTLRNQNTQSYGPAADNGHVMNDYKYHPPYSPPPAEADGSAVHSQSSHLPPSELEGTRYR